MKLCTLFILLVSTFHNIDAQRYIQFEMSAEFVGYHWSVDGWTLQVNHVDFEQAVHKGVTSDTIIQNGVFSEYFGFDFNVSLYNDRPSQSYLIIWEDTISDMLMGISQEFYPDSLSSRSVVLYNYNQNIGDTVHSDMLNMSSKAPFFIVSVDTMDYVGMSRRTLHCESFNYPNVQFDIIEGLGTNLGFLTNVNEWIEGGTVMECGYFENAVYGNSECFVSINENLIEIQTSPNPFQDNLNIQLSEQIQGHVTILDLQGKVCHQEKLSSFSRTINLASLQSGIYLLNVANENGVVVAHQKIVKQE